VSLYLSIILVDDLEVLYVYNSWMSIFAKVAFLIPTLIFECYFLGTAFLIVPSTLLQLDSPTETEALIQ